MNTSKQFPPKNAGNGACLTRGIAEVRQMDSNNDSTTTEAPTTPVKRRLRRPEIIPYSIGCLGDQTQIRSLTVPANTEANIAGLALPSGDYVVSVTRLERGYVSSFSLCVGDKTASVDSPAFEHYTATRGIEDVASVKVQVKCFLNAVGPNEKAAVEAFRARAKAEREARDKNPEAKKAGRLRRKAGTSADEPEWEDI